MLLSIYAYRHNYTVYSHHARMSTIVLALSHAMIVLAVIRNNYIHRAARRRATARAVVSGSSVCGSAFGAGVLGHGPAAIMVFLVGPNDTPASGLLRSRSSAALPPTTLPPLNASSSSTSLTVNGLTEITKTALGATPHYSRARTFTITAREAKPASLDALIRSKDKRSTKKTPLPQRLAKKRGAHAHEPLRTEGASWWTMSADVVEACDSFDRRHQRHWDVSETFLFKLQRDISRITKQNAFDSELQELRMNRYALREKNNLTAQTYEKRKGKERSKKKWTLWDSIWVPRTKWCDSLDFLDTEECELKLFQCDWERSLACGVGRYILKMDHDEDEDETHLDGMDEVQEVVQVLWEYHDLVYVAFDYYACQGASDDITAMSFNAFAQFVADCGLASNKSKFCKKTHFDQLFIAVDSSNAGGSKTGEKMNRKKALNRQEWLQCLVKMAIMRYVQSGEMADVSEALERLLRVDVEPNLDRQVFVEGNVFRDRYIYNEPVDVILWRHEANLRLIFEKLTRLKGQNAAAGIANKMVSFETWKEFARIFELYGDDLTERHITLAFVWSRMKVIDEEDPKTRVKLTHLAYEDFVEAICRLAAHKALPTDDELAKAESNCAGMYLRQMQADQPDEYADLISSRARPWASQPLLRMERCVEHMCSILVVTGQCGRGDNAQLTEKEAASFMGVRAAPARS